MTDSRADPASPVSAKRRNKTGLPRRWRRRLAYFAGTTVVVTLVLWMAIHRLPWLGPLIANTLRSVIGAEAVTWIEDVAYGVEDRFNRIWKKDEKPKAYWQVPPSSSAPPPRAKHAQLDEVELPPFAPKPPGPVHSSWSAPGDGEWVPIVDPRRPDDEVRMMKTLLHPDKNRSWAELFVVAVDLSRVSVHPVAGYQEPKSDKPEARDYKRHAKIPEKDHRQLLAAFNGGFMTEHGKYGMMLDGVTLVDPKDTACTLAKYQDGSFAVSQWKKLADTASKMQWYRQAPNCMYDDGVMHPLLEATNVRHWGATLDGETVIRRSAVGLDEAKTTLFVGISNHTNARVMAEGMHHAGAHGVAQLDVNWSYPKFVLYQPNAKGGRLVAVALAEGFEFSEDEYIRSRSMRDFFYLTRKAEPGPATEK